MKGTPDIRAIQVSEHYEAVSRMMHELHKHEYLLFDKTADWKDIETSYMRHVITQQTECDGLFLAAYINDAPIGFIFGYLEEQDDSRIEINLEKELYVSDGYVDKEYRGQGIYRQLNERLEAHYIAKGIKRIIRFTRVNNTRMRQFLDSKEYVVTRLLYEKWL